MNRKLLNKMQNFSFIVRCRIWCTPKTTTLYKCGTCVITVCQKLFDFQAYSSNTGSRVWCMLYAECIIMYTHMIKIDCILSISPVLHATYSISDFVHIKQTSLAFIYLETKYDLMPKIMLAISMFRMFGYWPT